MVASWPPLEGTWRAVLLVTGLAWLSCGSDGESSAGHRLTGCVCTFEVTGRLMGPRGLRGIGSASSHTGQTVM